MLDEELPTRSPADVRKRVPRAVNESASPTDGVQKLWPGRNAPRVVNVMRSRRRLHSTRHALRVSLVADGRPNARMADASVADRRGWKAPTLATAPFEVRIVNVDCASAGADTPRAAATRTSAPGARSETAPVRSETAGAKRSSNLIRCSMTR